MRLPPDFEREAVASWYTESDPPDRPLELSALFKDPRPTELEVGFGKGRFLVTAAEAYPDINFLGIELREKLALYTAWRAQRREIPNLHVLRADARSLLADHLGSGTMAAIHFYFPDPWWKKRHTKRRVFIPGVFESYARLLQPAARLNLASDVAHVFEEMVALARLTPGLRELEHAEPLLDVTTNFEDKANRVGRPIQRAVFERA